MKTWLTLLIIVVIAYGIMYWLIKQVQKNSKKWGRPDGKPEKQKETDLDKMKRNY